MNWVYLGFKTQTCHGRIIVLADENEVWKKDWRSASVG